MKTRKLKKSLSVIFLSKVYFKSPFFIIQKEKNSKTFKYPLYIKFFDSLEDIQTNCPDNSEFAFLSFKEFFLKTESSILKSSAFLINSIKHLEHFLKKDCTFLNYTELN